MALHNNVFKEQVWTSFVEDLESCLSVSKIKQKDGEQKEIFPGGLNFTAALTIFSVIEFATGFFSGKKANDDSIAKFISKYIGKYCSKLSEEKIAKKWYSVFRNGLSHQYSPKFGGIAMDFNNQRAFLFVTQDKGETIPVINIPSLFNVVKKALKNYESDLNSDDLLREKFEKRYKEVRDIDFQEMKRLREMCGIK